jgi:MFS family permease
MGLYLSMANYAGTSRLLGGLGDPYGFRARLLVYASGVSLVGACAVVAVSLVTGWSWSLFLWGLGVGLLGPVMSEVLRGMASSYLALTPQQLADAQVRVRAHRLLVIPMGVAVGLAVGLLAGAFVLVWIDIVATVMLLVFGLLPALIKLPRMKGRGDTGGSS